FGHANLGALGGCQSLLAMYVRPAWQEVRWDTDNHVDGSGRNGAGPELALQIFSRNAEKDAELVAGLPELDLQLGDLRLRLRQRARRLVHVEFRGGAVLEADPGNIQRLFLQLDVGSQVDQLLFDRADLDISRRDLAEQGHQHIVIVLHRGVEVVVGRL